MPRPNRTRSAEAERQLAARIAHERERRRQSYESLAHLMTRAGCAIQPSALYKIEKGDPPRRIVVNELVALADVWGMSIPELLEPHWASEQRELQDLIDKAWTTEAAVLRADADNVGAWQDLRDYLETHPGLENLVAQHASHARALDGEGEVGPGHYLAAKTLAELGDERWADLAEGLMAKLLATQGAEHQARTGNDDGQR